MTKGRAFQLREIRAREVSPGDAEMLSSTVDTGVTRSEAVVLEIDLERIEPDFDQPRWILPSALRARLQEGQISSREAIEQLVRRRDSEDLVRMILEGEGYSSGLLGLAESIGEVGLRQPINVYEIADASHPTGVGYRIGEGERRYWAHWILVLGGREEFKRIICVVERGVPDALQVRIRQLAENAARQDLPAMARARLMLGLKTCLARAAGVGVSSQASLRELEEAITRARYGGSGTRVPRPGVQSVDTQASAVTVPDSNELDEMVGQTLRQATGKAVSGRMVRNYLALLRLPDEVQELANAGGLSEFPLRPVTTLDDPDQQLKVAQRIVEEGLSGRRVDALVKEARAGAEEGKRRIGRAKVKSLTPLGLRRRLRSMLTYFEKQMEEMGGPSHLSAELRGVEEYREALDEMVSLRDLLNRILEEMEIEGHTPAARMRITHRAED
jgi:ParB-like chromosome segregation protein Spo0J